MELAEITTAEFAELTRDDNDTLDVFGQMAYKFDLETRRFLGKDVIHLDFDMTDNKMSFYIEFNTMGEELEFDDNNDYIFQISVTKGGLKPSLVEIFKEFNHWLSNSLLFNPSKR